MNKILLSICISLLPLFLVAQISEKVSIDWTGLQSEKTIKDLEVSYYSFENATNLPQFGALPIYTNTVDLPADVYECEIEVRILTADTLDIDIRDQITDVDLVTYNVQVDAEYHNNVAQIYVLPFVRDSKSDKIIRLKEFELLIDLVPVVPAVKQQSATNNYASNSVLSSGAWFKLGIVETGVHKISYNDLVNQGVDPLQLVPSKVGVFGSYTGPLPEENNKTRPDDLMENAIQIIGENDGSFDEEDYILFYANSVITWKYNYFTNKFDHQNNLYADTVYYFLTTSEGTNKRIAELNSVDDEPSKTVNTFLDRIVHENELESLIYSGKEWYGERLNGDTLVRNFTFTFPDSDISKQGFLKFDIAGRSYEHTYFSVAINDQVAIDSTRISRVNSNSSTYASSVNRSAIFDVDNDVLNVKVEYLADDNLYTAWINYISLNVERFLNFQGGQILFRNPDAKGAGSISRFEINTSVNEATVWEITDPFSPLAVNTETEAGVLHYTLPTDNLREFVIFDNSYFHTPVEIIEVANQDLHAISSVNYIIISPDEFQDQAERLADLHRSRSNLNVKIVSPEEIYNEFSSGSQDISAIRDFMRMLYIKGAFGEQPAYLMMFGDASYDYKYRVHENTNLVPTYQSNESLRHTGSFVTDDYFGLLDDHEGSNSTGEIDIGIGRFPVSTHEQAVQAVNKVEHYMSKSSTVMRNWRNEFCFIADFGDKNLHLDQASLLVSIADTLHPGININKVFADAFPMTEVPGGVNIPKANELIQRQVENGALIMNYTGHGGLIGWSKAVILNMQTIHGFTNYNQLPLFITATCEFSRFDDPEFTSAGEYVFLNENGGGIALLTTTRLAYAHANIVINMRIYENMLQDEEGKWPRLGDLVRLSKVPSSKNYLNFVLLGDPALRLAYPEHNVITTNVNNKSTSDIADTVQALSLVSVSGRITDFQNNFVEDFNGYVYPKVFDKKSKYTTLGQSTSYEEEFKLRDKVLFDGKVSVINGEFDFSFVIPKDIAYNYDFGKISYYALDTVTMTDAWGAYENIFIGGSDESADPDNTGPEISLFINDKGFISGDQVSSKSTFFAEISDDQGVNFTGHSLGRDIVMVMDDNDMNSMVMNEYFSYDVDSYQSGRLDYFLENLAYGWHTISLKAWDSHNNSSTELIDFYVDDQAEILLSDVINYPNPFREYTNFGFVTNKSGANLEVEIKIYDLHGRYIGQIIQDIEASSSTAPIGWNGRDSNGNVVPSGVYTYNIIVTDYYGNKTIQQQKMIKISD